MTSPARCRFGSLFLVIIPITHHCTIMHALYHYYSFFRITRILSDFKVQFEQVSPAVFVPQSLISKYRLTPAFHSVTVYPRTFLYWLLPMPGKTSPVSLSVMCIIDSYLTSRVYTSSFDSKASLYWLHRTF